MADIGITEIAAVTQSRVSEVIQTQLIEKSKLLGTVSSKWKPMPGESVIKIPRTGDFTVDNKVENVAVTAQILTYATDDLLLNLYKAIQFRVEDRAAIQATPDVIEDMIKRSIAGIQLQVDTDIAACIAAVSTAAPDHKIAYANATDLKKADILEARALLHEANVPFNECFIGVSPRSETSLLAIDDFVHADKYGSAEGLRNGELGRLYGAPVIMSTVFADLETLVWHPDHVAFGFQLQAKFEKQRDVELLADLYSVSQLYGCKTLDGGKRGVLLGTAV